MSAVFTSRLVGQRLEGARRACVDHTNVVEVARVAHARRRGNGTRATRGVGVQRTRRALAGGGQMLKLSRHTQDTAALPLPCLTLPGRHGAHALLAPEKPGTQKQSAALVANTSDKLLLGHS